MCDASNYLINLNSKEKEKLLAWIGKDINAFMEMQCRNWITIEPNKECFNYVEKTYEDGEIATFPTSKVVLEKQCSKPYEKTKNEGNLNEFIIKHMSKISGIRAKWDFAKSGDTLKEKYESLYVKMCEISSFVYSQVGSGANFIVTNPAISLLFESSHTFICEDCGIDVKYAGIVNFRWKLYKSLLVEKNIIIMGYKGESDSDSGIFVSMDRLTDNEFSLGIRPKGGRFYATIEVENYMI